MLTSKERSLLRSAANEMPSLYQVGKDGISENTIKQFDEALTARGLIKASVQKNTDDEVSSICNSIAAAVGADIVQVIGRKFVLYRFSKEVKAIRVTELR
jgi:RNA-binding protein